MSISSGVRHLPLAELARFCGEETKKYRRGESSDSSACHELFRRAICKLRSMHGPARAVLL